MESVGRSGREALQVGKGVVLGEHELSSITDQRKSRARGVMNCLKAKESALHVLDRLDVAADEKKEEFFVENLSIFDRPDFPLRLAPFSSANWE